MNPTAGHVDIEQRDVWSVLRCELEGVLGRSPFATHLATARLECRPDARAHACVVVSQDDSGTTVAAVYHATVTTLPAPDADWMESEPDSPRARSRMLINP